MRVSALMDGELAGAEPQETLRALRADSSLRREWGDFHVIGDALRREGGLGVDITSRVMAAIETEPAILVPGPRRRSVGLSRSLLALAASVAGVAVVGWIALGDAARNDVPRGGGTLAVAPAPTVSASLPPRLQEYLVAHQAHAPSNTPVGATRYIRAVSAERSGR